MTGHEELHPATQLIAAARPPREPGAPAGPPVTFTSTYVAGGEVDYARTSNPTWEALEELLGGLERGKALSFASGIAAISAVLSLVPHGGVVVAPRHAYSGTSVNLNDLASDGGAEVRRVDIEDTEAVVQACQGADLLLLESPTNPMMEVADLEAIIPAAQERGVVVACDNTFATPLGQQPLRLGADVVVHSVTKYLSGHSDVLLGALITRPGAVDAAGRSLYERLLHQRSLRGAIPGPMEAWLALRGMRTLEVRWERANANASALVAQLLEHPAVERVRYPGWGAIVAIDVRGGAEAAERIAAATTLWLHSTSLGGVESQIERRRRHTAEVDTVPENLLRLSVGIEHVGDLWADLEQALSRAAG